MNPKNLLLGYSAVLTAAFAIFLTTAAAPPGHNLGTFQELNVQRINIREPDGTLRMTLTGAKKMPGFHIAGKEYPQERGSAGLLFFNEEGSETGGLLFSGRNVDGKLTSSGSLTFDRFEQDQVVQILEREDGSSRFSGLLISDRPEGRLDYPALVRARQAKSSVERKKLLRAANAGEAHRIIVARDSDNGAGVSLRDSNGRERLLLRVDGDGAASIQFLDMNGKVTKIISSE